uniref:Uncharacterized protein n=1 Tax=viral metagenome TaxID=1070528 RepID=A0A6M3LMN3_9ZZZZ
MKFGDETRDGAEYIYLGWQVWFTTFPAYLSLASDGATFRVGLHDAGGGNSNYNFVNKKRLRGIR